MSLHDHSSGPSGVLAEPAQQRRTIAVTMICRDRPGVTCQVLATLARFGVTVLDIEQMVLRRQLVLGVLVTAPREEAALREELDDLASGLDAHVELARGEGDNLPRPQGRSHVTVIGAPLRSPAVAALTGRIADMGANIDRIERMARYPVTAIDLHVSGISPERLREVLAREASSQQVDLAVQPAGLLRRSTRLIVMDVDSTLVQGEVIEMIAAHAGCEAEVAAVTERAMRGELDFEQSLRERVRLLRGVPATALDEVYASLELTPGARTTVRTLKRLGYRFAIVSGGFSQVTDRLAADLGLDFARANELEIIDGRLTGEVLGSVVDRPGKAAALRDFAERCGIPVSATVAVGDGANDLDMLAAAGLGIAFNAKPVVRERAQTSVNVPYLDTVLYLMGISREEVVAADAEEGVTTPAPPVEG